MDSKPFSDQDPPAPLPALWNPNAAACWSLLFTPAFGAFLHMRNAKVMGRADEARANQWMFWISLAFLVVASISDFMPGLSAIPDNAFRMGGVGMLVSWYLVCGKKQVDHVDAAYPNGYTKKSWLTPLLIAFGCLVGLFMVFFVVVFVQEELV